MDRPLEEAMTIASPANFSGKSFGLSLATRIDGQSSIILADIHLALPCALKIILIAILLKTLGNLLTVLSSRIMDSGCKYGFIIIHNSIVYFN